MSGIMLALFGTSSSGGGGPPPADPGITVSCGGASGNVSAASGFIVPIEATVTDPGNPQTNYSFSFSKVTGSSKLSINSTTGPTSTVGGKVTIAFSGLAVGEQAVAIFNVTATRSGYTDGSTNFVVDLTRTS